MSNELKSSFSNHNPVVNNTSFSGGVVKGKCFQMTQMKDNNIHDVQVIQMTREQVIKQINTMIEWMA